MKAVRTDRELECPEIDTGLRARGVELVTLPDGISEEALAREVAEADLLLSLPIRAQAREVLLIEEVEPDSARWRGRAQLPFRRIT